VLYRAYGLILSSSHRIPELAPVGRGRAALRLQFERGTLAGQRWYGASPRPQEDGRPWLIVSRRGELLRMQFRTLADFVWDPMTRTLTAFRRGGTPAQTIRHLALDQALPLVLGHEGFTVLHASACVTPAGTVAFLGPTGAGKSTMAAAFGATGCPVIADDAVLLTQRGNADLIAVPAYAGSRLWSDVLPVVDPRRRGASRGRTKRRLGRHDRTLRFAKDPAPLRRVYLLKPRKGTDVLIEPLSRRDSLIELIKHTYVLEVRDRAHLLAHFDRLTRDCVPLGIRMLTYPHDVAMLPRVCAAILADASSA